MIGAMNFGSNRSGQPFVRGKSSIARKITYTDNALFSLVVSMNILRFSPRRACIGAVLFSLSTLAFGVWEKHTPQGLSTAHWAAFIPSASGGPSLRG